MQKKKGTPGRFPHPDTLKPTHEVKDGEAFVALDSHKRFAKMKGHGIEHFDLDSATLRQLHPEANVGTKEQLKQLNCNEVKKV